MKVFKFIAISVFLLALCGLFVPSASAGELDRKTTVTFSGPVEVPGDGAQVLPAGTYVFKVLESMSNRHIVQIFNPAEDHLYTTILAIPNSRLQPTGKTVITFKEMPAGQPEAIRAWFSPGRTWGEEFVYAKPRAVELSKAVQQPILATPVELATAPIEALKTAPVEAVKPTGETVELAQVVEPPPLLPQTASWLPLIGLVGLLSLGAGFALALIPKRAASIR
jgi:hypothetical protein